MLYNCMLRTLIAQVVRTLQSLNSEHFTLVVAVKKKKKVSTHAAKNKGDKRCSFFANFSEILHRAHLGNNPIHIAYTPLSSKAGNLYDINKKHLNSDP